jgi:ATP-dependent Clp protease ATP-binding subunit ClpC
MAGFERYPRKQDIMFNLTQTEAKELGHNFIGTEHLLLAILLHGENIAAMALSALA